MLYKTFLIARIGIKSRELFELNWIVKQAYPYKEFESLDVLISLLNRIFSHYKKAYETFDTNLLITHKEMLFNFDRWILVENEDKEICAYFLYKAKRYGIKLSYTFSDGSHIGRKAVIAFNIKAFHVLGVIGEVSPPLEKKIINKVPIIKASNVPNIIGKEITPDKDGEHYKRKLGKAGVKRKILVGKLKIINYAFPERLK